VRKFPKYPKLDNIAIGKNQMGNNKM